MKRCMFFVVFLLLSIATAHAETINMASYYPVGQGDKWIFDQYDGYYCGAVSGSYTWGGITGVSIYLKKSSTRNLSELADCVNGSYAWKGLILSNNQLISPYFDYTVRNEVITYDPPTVVLPATMTFGQPYISNYTETRTEDGVIQYQYNVVHSSTLEGTEDITVLAGTFPDSLRFKVVETKTVSYDRGTPSNVGTSRSYQAYEWLAKNVGAIKSANIQNVIEAQLVVADVGGIHYGGGAPLTSNCAATLASDFKAHVPIGIYNGQPYSADFQWDGGNGVILNNLTPLNDTSLFSNCTPSTVSTDLRLHIPVIMFNGVSYWVDVQCNTSGLPFAILGIGQN